MTTSQILPEVNQEYDIDLKDEMDVEHFVDNYGFYKIADVDLKDINRFIKNPEVNPIEYIPVKGLEEKYNEYRELIYIIAIDGKVVKIGGTYVGMKGRHQSYNCGTRKARKKGTCSVTNYNITETQYTAFMNGSKVEWYVFDVPSAEMVIDVFGESVRYNTKTFYKYESSLCERYNTMVGHFPPFSVNSGVE